MSTLLRRATTVAIVCLAATSVALAGPRPRDNDSSKDDNRKPKLALRANPGVSISPSRVVFTAELNGGANDYEEFYCASADWDWGDGTESESSADCEPYQAGKSEIKRRYTVQHVFRAGVHKVAFRLRKNARTLATATVTIQVQPGVQDGH